MISFCLCEGQYCKGRQEPVVWCLTRREIRSMGFQQTNIGSTSLQPNGRKDRDTYSHTPAFDAKTFVSTVGAGRQLISFRTGEAIFTQGDKVDAVFAILKGRVLLQVRSTRGRQTSLDILSNHD